MFNLCSVSITAKIRIIRKIEKKRVGKYIDFSIALQGIVQILIGSSKILEYCMIHSGCSDNIVGHICQLFGI